MAYMGHFTGRGGFWSLGALQGEFDGRWISEITRGRTCVWSYFAAARRAVEPRCGRLKRGLQLAHLGTPLFDLFLDRVAHFAGPCEFLFGRSLKARRIRKAPMQSFGDAGKNRAAFGACFVTDGDHIGK